ncbi:MAG: PAS domain-containing protein [Caulobacterales bacterium]
MSAQFKEDTRLAILAEHAAEGLQDDEALQALTRFGANLCETPICLVSLVEADRQCFIGRAGLDATETGRDVSFCQFAMLGDDIMVVPDAQADVRFSQNALVLGAPGIRFYAGAPLRSEEGAALGALCVIDRAPRSGLSKLQHQGLIVLARQVSAVLQARRRQMTSDRSEVALEAALTERSSSFRVLADAMPQMVWSTTANGCVDYFNARWFEFTGAALGSTNGEAWTAMIHPEQREQAAARWRRSVETGEPYEIEYRLQYNDGDYRWALARALPMLDSAGKIVRWYGTCTDIHEHKKLLEERQVVSQELSHRIKNIFSIIAGMISLSARRHPHTKDVAESLRDRVVSLGRAHDFVRPHSSASVPKASPDGLHGMLRQIFEPYDNEGGPRIVILGDNPDIDDRATTPLALMFHELATNAAKYGALSADGGSVSLSVLRDGGQFVFEWRENDGPPIASAPESLGFGSQLIELSAVRQLGGKVERDWAKDGLRLKVVAPGASLMRAA